MEIRCLHHVLFNFSDQLLLSQRVQSNSTHQRLRYSINYFLLLPKNQHLQLSLPSDFLCSLKSYCFDIILCFDVLFCISIVLQQLPSNHCQKLCTKKKILQVLFVCEMKQFCLSIMYFMLVFFLCGEGGKLMIFKDRPCLTSFKSKVTRVGTLSDGIFYER